MNINSRALVEKITRVPSSDTGSEPCRAAGARGLPEGGAGSPEGSSGGKTLAKARIYENNPWPCHCSLLETLFICGSRAAWGMSVPSTLTVYTAHW